MSALYDILIRILRKKWSFLAIFLLVFFFTLSALVAMGAAPTFVMHIPRDHIYTPLPLPAEPVQSEPLFTQGEGELPIGIDIPSVGVKANVGNPSSTDVEALDEALLSGAVRYPTSAKLGEDGNVIIFGHSSHLPVVHNQAFKAFNEIATLSEGDPIFVYSRGRRYTYAVESVKEETADTGTIPLVVEGSKLTLATCDNFGEKADRFIVTAVLVSVAEAEPAE